VFEACMMIETSAATQACATFHSSTRLPGRTTASAGPLPVR
jgi:hypothetical protein